LSSSKVEIVGTIITTFGAFKFLGREYKSYDFIRVWTVMCSRCQLQQLKRLLLWQQVVVMTFNRRPTSLR